VRYIDGGGRATSRGTTKAFARRGLGEVPYSALRIKPEYADFDAERRFGITYRSVPDNKACECGAILRGVKKPVDCKLFGTVCTPENPIGSCMVSSEGACAAHYSYGRFKDGGRSGGMPLRHATQPTPLASADASGDCTQRDSVGQEVRAA